MKIKPSMLSIMIAVSVCITTFVFVNRESETTAKQQEKLVVAEQAHWTAIDESPKKLPRRPAASDKLDLQTQEPDRAIISELEKYPGFSGSEKEEELFSQEEQAREEYIARCMQTRGYHYVPTPSIVVNEADMGDPEEFERLLHQAAQDPNDSYVNTLSLGEKKAYYLALTGMENPNDPEGQAQELAMFSDSCVNRAFNKIAGVFAKRNALSEELDRMEGAIAEDQRIVAATESWSSCMTDSGYRFANPSKLYQASDSAVADLELNPRGAQAQQDLHDTWEHSFAALEACQQKTQLLQVWQQVRVEYENAFVQTYRERLEDGN